MQTAVLVVVALTTVYSFYSPLSESSLSSNALGLVLFAIGFGFAGIVSYVEYAGRYDFDKAKQDTVVNYFNSASAWVVCYIFWYAFDIYLSQWVETDFGKQNYVAAVVILGVVVFLAALLTTLLINLFDANLEAKLQGTAPADTEHDPLLSDEGSGNNDFSGGDDDDDIVTYKKMLSNSALMSCIPRDKLL